MEPNAIAVLSGMGGALAMLLLVLLALVGWGWPLIKSVIRSVGNFKTVTLSRASGTVRVVGELDDWRETFRPLAPLRDSEFEEARRSEFEAQPKDETPPCTCNSPENKAAHLAAQRRGWYGHSVGCLRFVPGAEEQLTKELGGSLLSPDEGKQS